MTMAEPRACPQCGLVFTPPYKQRKRKFCGHSCAIRFHRPGRFNTPEGIARRADAVRGTGKGYVKRGGRHEHRVVVEAQIGRPLLPSEIVHHADEDKKNNAPGNLEVTTRRHHGRIHNLGRKRPVVTVCKFGHPLKGDNVEITWAGNRRCKTCRRRYDREWKRAARRSRWAAEGREIAP